MSLVTSHFVETVYEVNIPVTNGVVEPALTCLQQCTAGTHEPQARCPALNVTLHGTCILATVYDTVTNRNSDLEITLN